MTAEQIEQEYMNFCATVEKDASRVMAMAANGRDGETIARAALALAQSALTQQNQYKMRKESAAGADRYDLGALKVDAAAASNSETGWERED